MTGALTFLLISCLMWGAECGGWSVSIPEELEVMAGSSLTINCTFDIDSNFQNDLNSNCKAVWKSKDVNDANTDSKLNTAIEKTADLTKKNCTTVLKNLCPLHSDKYYFRLHCDNRLKWNYKEKTVNILVKAAPPSVTLKPSTLEVKEGTSVSLSCSAPAVCLSHPPTLTWTSSLEDSQRTLQENQDKTQVVTSVLNFTASHLHHGKIISCSAVYRKPDGSPDEAVTKSLTAAISYSPKNTKVSVSPSGPVAENRTVTLTCSSDANPPVKNYTWFRADGDQETFTGTGPVLTITASRVNRFYFCKAGNDLGDRRSNNGEIDVQFPAQILPSSDCNETAEQVSCSCETVGNPSPSVHWYLDGLPVNQSDKITVTTKPKNRRRVRSIITVNQIQEKDFSTLLCCSINSLGSSSHQFCGNSQDRVLFVVFITTSAVLLVLVCVLLFVIRALRKSQSPKGRLTDETNTAAYGELPVREGNETTQHDINVNSSAMKQEEAGHPAAGSQLNSATLPNSGNAEGTSESSEKNAEDLIYANVTWKTKSKKKRTENSMDVNQFGFYLEEMKSVAGSRHFTRNALEMGGLCEEVRPGNVREEVECEYSQVKPKKKPA